MPTPGSKKHGKTGRIHNEEQDRQGLPGSTIAKRQDTSVTQKLAYYDQQTNRRPKILEEQVAFKTNFHLLRNLKK